MTASSEYASTEAIRVACPECHAAIDEQCVVPGGYPRSPPHWKRIEAWRASRDAAARGPETNTTVVLTHADRELLKFLSKDISRSAYRGGIGHRECGRYKGLLDKLIAEDGWELHFPSARELGDDPDGIREPFPLQSYFAKDKP